MADLKKLLEISDINKRNALSKFTEIAETLMRNYVIKKGQKEYAIIEIEFYLYSPSHRDYITYPREIEAGRWFFHQSGVDLSFKSFNVKDIKKVENEKQRFSEATFGGILIRGIYKLDNSIKEEERYIFGPQNCVNELWDNFDAFKKISNKYPFLELDSKVKNNFHTIHLIPYKRHIKLGKDKTIEIKEKEWAERIGIPLSNQRGEEKGKENIKIEKEDSAMIDTLEAKYRFFNIIDGENTWKEIKHLTKTEKDDLKKLIKG